MRPSNRLDISQGIPRVTFSAVKDWLVSVRPTLPGITPRGSPSQTARRPWMTWSNTTTIATTSRKWIRPPIVVEVTMPRAHNTSRMTQIVQTIANLSLTWFRTLGTSPQLLGNISIHHMVADCDSRDLGRKSDAPPMCGGRNRGVEWWKSLHIESLFYYSAERRSPPCRLIDEPQLMAGMIGMGTRTVLPLYQCCCTLNGSGHHPGVCRWVNEMVRVEGGLLRRLTAAALSGYASSKRG